MRSFRHFGFLLCLAFALAIGQQAALLHALGHATEQVQKGDTKPAKSPCDQCALAGQPWGGTAAGLPPVPMASGVIDAVPFVERIAPARTVVVFLSRAPPVLS